MSRYGVVGGTVLEPGVLRIEAIVEKPSPEKAPSRLAVAGRLGPHGPIRCAILPGEERPVRVLPRDRRETRAGAVVRLLTRMKDER